MSCYSAFVAARRVQSHQLKQYQPAGGTSGRVELTATAGEFIAGRRTGGAAVVAVTGMGGAVLSRSGPISFSTCLSSLPSFTYLSSTPYRTSPTSYTLSPFVLSSCTLLITRTRILG